ncbi:methyltransferase-like protein 7A isoform X1 [Nasonia vitripennis]|uniref:Methyltransferase type 11 domain-containing protein n=1 Tax=Nasonia vitripennis TaxID=7425 RepID=A0A7M7H3M8_NASVI|nr:methyltransferase-like protein 7A isoform X1 [Nasonia vitripennis]
MSTIDLWVRDLVTKYGLIVIVFVVLSSLISWKWSRFRQSNYKAFLIGFETECAELASSYKKKLFAPLEHMVSHDEVLRSLNSIRILEIGVKTGRYTFHFFSLSYTITLIINLSCFSFSGDNIQYYPEGAHFIAVDCNRKLGDYLVNGDRAWQYEHVIFERLIIADGSSLKGIPTGCVDVVVTTRSLCSTKSTLNTLKEIRRILAPGGRYLFFEHLPDEQGSFISRVQMILTRTRIWPALYGGCRLDSNPTKDIENIGFEEVKLEHVVLQGYVSQPHHLLLSRHHIVGSATR